MGKNTRGIELESLDELAEARLSAWIQQAANMPFAGAAARKR